MRLVGQRCDRGPPVPDQAEGHDAVEFDIPREATRDGTYPDLDRRAGPRRQRPRLSGGRGVVDQEIGQDDSGRTSRPRRSGVLVQRSRSRSTCSRDNLASSRSTFGERASRRWPHGRRDSENGKARAMKKRQVRRSLTRSHRLLDRRVASLQGRSRTIRRRRRRRPPRSRRPTWRSGSRRSPTPCWSTTSIPRTTADDPLGDQGVVPDGRHAGPGRVGPPRLGGGDARTARGAARGCLAEDDGQTGRGEDLEEALLNGLLRRTSPGRVD